MSWSAPEEELVTITPHHPSSPSRVGFAEHHARGCHTGLVESAAMAADHAATRLRMVTQHPCLPSLGQQEIPLDIPLGRKPTCALSATACPPSFRARVSGTELAIFHPSTHLYGAAPFYRPHELPTMSASLVHPKLDSLPALDMESDRLARACGQGPSFSARSSFSQDDPTSASWDERPRTSERRGQPLSSSSASSSQPHGSPPRWDPRAVLRSLQAALERDDAQLPLGECVDVQGVLERWAAHGHRRAHSAAAPRSAVRMQMQRERGGLNASAGTFGAPVSVAVKCASMSTVLGGFQHPIPWVVYACVEELNRTGIYQPGLFRAVPHRSRLEKLISGFDCALPPTKSNPDFESPCPPCTPTASSTRASLRKESMADVCALLKSYMDSLPEPLLHENLTSALHRLCVEPSDKREQEKSTCEHDDSSGYFHLPPSISHRASGACTHGRTRSNPVSPASLSPLLMTPSEKRSADLSLENAQVHIAQHLLRLAAPPLCSLFAYLCAFFTQLPLSPDNGITLDDVSRMFGRSLAGGPVSTRNAVLMWLLERWPRVADGLFNICPTDLDEGEDVTTSVFSPFSPALAPSTRTDTDAKDPAQSPDSTPHAPYSVPEVSVSMVEARRRGSLVSLDGAESIFTASTADSDDGVYGVRTPFSSEFPTVPLPAVREYEFEPEWEEPPSVHPMLNGGVENGMAALSSAQVYSPGSNSEALLKLDPDAFILGSAEFKRPANSNSRTDSLRSSSELTLLFRRVAPHSPPPESELDSPSPSAVHSRSASRGPGVSENTSKHTSDSPLSILRRLGFRESSPHRSASVRKKKNAAAHRRGAADGEPASNGGVEP
ncbi:hypothetical protein V8D89_001324 [Ganoderma adspersum]